MTEEERYLAVVKVWEEADKVLTKALLDGLINITTSS